MKSKHLADAEQTLANAANDHAAAYLHAFTTLLREAGYLTEDQIMKALAEFDESLQTTYPG